MKKYLLFLLVALVISCHTDSDKKGNKGKEEENEFIHEEFINDSTILIDKESYTRANAVFEEFRTSARKNPTVEAENEIIRLAGEASEMKRLLSTKSIISNYLNDDSILEYDFILTDRFLSKFFAESMIDSTKNKAISMFFQSVPYLTYVSESELCPAPLKELIELFLLPLNNYNSKQLEFDIELQHKIYNEKFYSRNFRDEYNRIRKVGRAKR
jgi:hypothetical protein